MSKETFHLCSECNSGLYELFITYRIFFQIGLERSYDRLLERYQISWLPVSGLWWRYPMFADNISMIIITHDTYRIITGCDAVVMQRRVAILELSLQEFVLAVLLNQISKR